MAGLEFARRTVALAAVLAASGCGPGQAPGASPTVEGSTVVSTPPPSAAGATSSASAGAGWETCPSVLREELAAPEPTILEPTGALRVARSVELPGTPAFLAYGSDSVWASGTEGELWRVDVASGEIVDELVAGTDPFIWLAFGHGSLWFARPADGALVRLDPDSGATTEIQLRAGDRPMTIAFDDSSTWVANQSANTIHRVDALTHEILAEVDLAAAGPTDPGPSGLGLLDGALWISEHRSDTVALYDPASGETRRACLGTPSPGRLAVTRDAVWIAEIGGLLTRVEPTGQKVTARLGFPGAVMGELATGPTEIWMGNGSHVVAYDFETEAVRAVALPELSDSSTFPGGQAIAVGPDSIWTTDPSGDRLLQVDLVGR